MKNNWTFNKGDILKMAAIVSFAASFSLLIDYSLKEIFSNEKNKTDPIANTHKQNSEMSSLQKIGEMRCE